MRSCGFGRNIASQNECTDFKDVAGREMPNSHSLFPWRSAVSFGPDKDHRNLRIASLSFWAAVVAGVLASGAWAQTSSKTGPKYDTKNEVKIKGMIEEVRQVPGSFEGTFLVVKTEGKTVVVRAAPADFLKEMEANFAKGDLVEVVGCKAPNTTEEEILAREIIVGQNTTTLRDDKGVPVWAGWKRGGK